MNRIDLYSLQGKQTFKGQSFEEESPEECLKTVEEVIKKGLLFADVARRNCLSTCRRLKAEVHYQINELIDILREREMELCFDIEKEYSSQVQKIDVDVTADCIDRINKRYDENKLSPTKTTLIFSSDFNFLKRRLINFGQLRYEDNKEFAKKIDQEFLESSKMPDPISTCAEDAPAAMSSASPFKMGSKVSPVSSASPFVLNSLAQHRIANEINLKEMKREPLVEEPLRLLRMRQGAEEQMEEVKHRLKILSLNNEKNLKINSKDELFEVYRHPTKLFVDHLPDGCTDSDLLTLFKKYGTVKECHVINKYGLVFMSTPEEAEDAIKALNNYNFSGSSLHVEQSKGFQKKVLGNKRTNQTIPTPQSFGEVPINTCESVKLVDLPGARNLSCPQGYDLQYEAFLNSYCPPINIASTTSSKSAASRSGKRAWSKSIGEDDDEYPQVNERVNNVEERVAIDKEAINKAYMALDQKCRMHLKTEETLNKYSILNQACHVISSLEYQLKEQNLNHEIPYLNQRKTEKNEEMPKEFNSSSGLPQIIDSFPQMKLLSSQSDEDDFEIICSDETASTSSELSLSPPLPPINPFIPSLASLSQKKAIEKLDLSSGSCTRSESSGFGGIESHDSSMSCAFPSGSDIDMKENPSLNQQPDQESSSKCLGGSKDEGQENNPTVALRSSFTKYLKKSPENEWLVQDKSSV